MQDWIIGVCSSGEDGVVLYRFRGTTDEVKEKLYSLVKEDRENDPENWDFGCESSDDIRDESGGLGHEFYGFGSYSDYHIDYTAKEFSHVEFA